MRGSYIAVTFGLNFFAYIGNGLLFSREQQALNDRKEVRSHCSACCH